MGIFDRFGGGAEPAPQPVIESPAAGPKAPQLGDKVWWAPKGVGCLITKIESDGSFVFQGGPIVKNKKGRETPRWTASAARPMTDKQLQDWATARASKGDASMQDERALELYLKAKKRAVRFRADLGMWIVGQGPTPKRKGEQLIFPQPVDMSGQATGSFAVGG